MLSQLVRTKFESNLMSFIVFIALVAAAGTRYLMTREVPQGPAPQELIITTAATLILFCAVAAVISLLRQSRERSNRLYAQLPVNPRAVRMAYWLHVSVYPAIAALLLHAVIQFGGAEPAREFSGIPAFFFLTLCLNVACFSLVTSNLSRLLPERVRRNMVMYCVVVVLATFLLNYTLAFLSVSLVGTVEGPGGMRKGLVMGATLAVALVALDIYSFGRKDRNFD